MTAPKKLTKGETGEKQQLFSNRLISAIRSTAEITPNLETAENAMKLSAMLIQAATLDKSPLMQLPHFNDEIIQRCLSQQVRKY